MLGSICNSSVSYDNIEINFDRQLEVLLGIDASNKNARDRDIGTQIEFDSIDKHIVTDSLTCTNIDNQVECGANDESVATES